MRATLVALVASVCAFACGGDEGIASDGRAVFTPCNGDYECASVEVPVDYANPDGPKISIAILRAPARDREARLGTVVVNPGGPGQPFVDRLARTYPVLSASFSEATARFDVVAFDWRGVGSSARVRCTDDAFFDRLRGADLTLKTPGSLEAVDALRKSLVAGCTAGADPALLSRMDTESAARDLERIRQALGEEKLDYLGFSYGTWLGATYATMFPHRVRALVLDSAVALGPDLQGDIAEKAKSFELGLTRFFETCARDAQCKLRGPAGATDAAAVAARFDALMTKLEMGGGLPAGGRTLSMVDMQFAIADGLRNGQFVPLASDLASAEAGDASRLLARADLVTGRGPDGAYDSTIVGLLAIACLDQPLAAGTTLASFQAFADQQRAARPRGAQSALLPWALCAEWPWRRASPRMTVSARTAPPLLVVAGRNDPNTGYERATRLVEMLGNGSHLVTYEGDGHTVSLRSACIREVVTSFLVDPTKPPSKLSCAPE